MTEQIHSSIIQAICKVQSGLGAVKKSQKNVHGGYMFASTDDIYAEVCRRMADAGLVVLPLEEDAEIQRVEKDGKVAQWARIVFSFVLATSEATWTDKRSKRTLFIQVTGPQTFQAAQSYAEKAYLRSLFKIPTGDMDLDAMAQADTEEGQTALNGSAKRKSSYSAKKDGITDDTFNEARYISREGWDGFNAASVRNALISACRLVGFKMTLAKMSLFVEADGWDEKEPQVPLIRIYAKPTKQEDMARVETGQPYVTVRAAYFDWKAKVRIKWDQDQFSLADVTNLLARVGMQVGLGEGRPDSKNSTGMGWGTFEIEQAKGA